MGTRTTNPVAVGDNVIFETDPKTGTGIISELLERKNYILRKASNLSKESQILASNVDKLFLMVTVILPATPAEFIDRFLIAAEAYRIPASIIINKTDIYGDEEMDKVTWLEEVYGRIGYRVYPVSVKKREGTDALLEKMKGSINLLAGNSGVGKSTLINLLNPSLNLKTGEVSKYHRQGKHITTFPEMHHLPGGGYIIDSPGIRGFGMVDMDRSEIYHFFPEIFRISKECKFYNCLHIDEPGCEVRKGAEEGIIEVSRYRSYLNIIDDDNRKYR